MTRRMTPLALLIAASSLMAQETTGTVTGRVTSRTGTPLQGATVRLTSPALLGERTAVTDSKGGYRIPLLPSGDFTVTITLKDFATSKGFFHVVAGQTSREDGVLTPMSEVNKVQTAEVVVESTMGQRDKTETVTQSIYSTEELMKTTTTDLFAAAWLSPGVDANQWGIQAPSIRGGSNVGTKILLNGSQVNDGAFSNWNFDPTIPDMVESMAVIQSPLNAKYGGTDSGIVSWVTTRGSNEFSGTLRRSYSRDFWSGSSGYNMDPNNKSNTTNQPNRLGQVFSAYQAPEGDARGQWQATLRGPIWKDHITFAYATKITPASYSPQAFQYNTGSPYDAVYTAFNNPANGQLITQAYIGDFEGKVMPYTSKASWNQYVLFAQINENHQLDFSYTQDDSSNTSYRSNTAGGTGIDDYFNSALSIGYKGILSNAGVLDARYGFTKRKWAYPSSNDPAINSMTGTQYYGSNGWRYAKNLLELWENYTPYYPVSGSPTDPGDGQTDTTADINYQHILQTAAGSHIIDVGGTYHKFEWDTPSPTGRAQNQFQNAGEIAKNYSDPNLAGKFIVFPWNATVADVAPGYWSNATAASQALMYNTADYYNLLPTLWQGQGLAHGYYHVATTSFYVNDLWTINNFHSLMVGLRDDKVTGADNTHTVITYSQITPRFEYKFDLGGDQKRVVNVSWAQFHQPLNGGIIQPFIQSRYAYQTTRYWSATNPNAANPKAPYLVDLATFTDPANYGKVANYTAPGVDRLDPNVKGMTNTEFTLGYRRNFDNGGSVRITYVDRNWKNLYDWFPDTQGTTFTNPYDPTASMVGLSRTLRIDPNAHRRYKAMETEWSVPITPRVFFGGNYSYARFTGNDNTNLTSVPYRGVKSLPNTSNWNALYYNQYYQQAGSEAAPDELRRPVHHLKGWFTFDIGQGRIKQALALRFNYDSGYPFSPTEPYALPNYTLPNSTPAYSGSRLPTATMSLPVGYNQFTYQGSYGFNLHYTLDVPIYHSLVWFFVADVGNVFQHITTNDYTPGNYNGNLPMWNASYAGFPYANGWRAQNDLSPAAAKSGFRTMSLETGIRF
ncbi:MAG TPA: carboxypeptidase regulatory-like domain-containing protein [Geothrix sp.]|nr:carboxypeptidase regulatory-like domain-containing protein [Geothrix sp.]